MKKPNVRLQRHQESRRKKQLARKKKLAAEQRELNLKMEEEKPKGLAPRVFRRWHLRYGQA